MLRQLRRLFKYSLLCLILYFLLNYSFSFPSRLKLNLLNHYKRDRSIEEIEIEAKLNHYLSRINTAMKGTININDELISISKLIVNEAAPSVDAINWGSFSDNDIKTLASLIAKAKQGQSEKLSNNLQIEFEKSLSRSRPERTDQAPVDQQFDTLHLAQKLTDPAARAEVALGANSEFDAISINAKQESAIDPAEDPQFNRQKEPTSPPKLYSSLKPENVILSDENSPDKNQFSSIVPTIVFACNRETVSRALDKLLISRSHLLHNKYLPIIVSQDTCDHQATKNIILKYSRENENVYYLEQTDRSDAAPDLPAKARRNQLGYYKLARHYKSGINSIFSSLDSFNKITRDEYVNDPDVKSGTLSNEIRHLVIIEDDLEVSEDFYSYMLAGTQVLDANKNLFCVSAWNDNGKPEFIDESSFANYKIHYSDFFPGLGWILKKSIWEEWRDKWPKAYWDDWVRGIDQRKDRSCLRPEVSRTQTFGKKGVSNGQFFEKHLKYMKLADTSNKNFISLNTWSNLLEPLKSKDQYNEILLSQLKSAKPTNFMQLKSICSGADKNKQEKYRVEYSSEANFKAAAKAIGIMSDSKSGVPRTGYLGVVQAKFLNCERVFISPPVEVIEEKYIVMNGYDVSWKGNP